MSNTTMRTRLAVPSGGWTGASLASAALVGWMPVLLQQGGTAPLFVAALASFAITAPAASGLRTSRCPPYERELKRWLLLGSAACAITSAMPMTWLPLMAIVWLAAVWLAAQRPAGSTFAIVASLWLALTLPLLHQYVAMPAAPDVQRGSPWHLLMPDWNAWQTWLPGALSLSLVLPGIALWPLSGSSPSSTRTPSPHIGAGVAVVVSAGVAWIAGVASASIPQDVMTGLPWSWGFLAVAACFGVTRWASEQASTRHITILALALTIWFMAGGEACRMWWWRTWLPLGLGILCLRQAYRERQANAALPALIGSAAIILSLYLALPGPEDIRDAVFVAATWVFVTWGVGWTSLQDEQQP